MSRKRIAIFITALFVLSLISTAVFAQDAKPGAQAASAEANGSVHTDEVDTPGHLLVAIYAAISGPAGERDWNHFRTLFLPEARFTRTEPKPDGTIAVNCMSVDDFVQAAGDYFKKEGFYENGVVNRVFRYGRMVDAISSYESRHAPAEKPFARGINSVQMISNGKRWWVVGIAWDDERPDNPMPKEFVKK
jgi:hypothetical protein